MSGRVLAMVLLVAGCAFDPAGASDPDREPGGQTDGAPVGESLDAAAPDAIPDCVDDDGDGYFVAVAGDDCGPELDCDDSDSRAHPGQTDYFGSERNAGAYDFDCDGVDSQVNVKQGQQCHLDWFDCEGTGWMISVPPCGETGTYHECKSGFLSCNEDQTLVALQLCR